MAVAFSAVAYLLTTLPSVVPAPILFVSYNITENNESKIIFQLDAHFYKPPKRAGGIVTFSLEKQK